MEGVPSSVEKEVAALPPVGYSLGCKRVLFRGRRAAVPKSAPNRRETQEGSKGDERVHQLVLPGLRVAIDPRETMVHLAVSAGLAVLQAYLEQDRVAICGPVCSRSKARNGLRWGSSPSEITLGGRRVKVMRPRVRSRDTEEEIELPNFAWASAQDPLVARTVEQILAGVSTRNYARSLEGVGAGVVSRSTSKSAASRRFVAATAKKIDGFMARRLESLELVAMMIDALEFAGEPVVAALGITADGHKEVLGLIHGSTENAAVCRDLLANLIERGLPTDRSLLFVLDGSKALHKAVVDTFGKRALIQRCTVHKRRNVREHLPKERQRAVDAVLRQAYRSTAVEKARALLVNQARTLEEDYPSAAASIREGLDETLTVMRLGLPDQIARTLTTTNPIESLMSVIRTKSRNVRRWRGGKMRLRWAVVGATEAQKAFRRIKGHRHLVALANRLREHDAKLDGRVLEKAKSATG